MKLIHSFIYAFLGIKTALLTQVNVVIHFIAACIALALAYFLKVSSNEFCLIVICIAMVISAELFNTAIELICDFIHPQQNEKIKRIKDISAGAVLVTAIAAFVIGLFIFLPKLLN